MAQVKRYTAKKGFKLDCGHAVKQGEEFFVTKYFSCEEDGKRLFVKQTLTQPEKQS